MPKKKPTSRKPSPAARLAGLQPEPGKKQARDSSSSSASGGQQIPSSAAIRETIESVVIAFVLAFLFRTFEAEAFVIPTGSMAPTLMGRHKDLECEACGYPYQVSASCEVDENGNVTEDSQTVFSSICPMCRYVMTDLNSGDYRSYKGDRILVAKFPYEFGEPQRWDVAVFKYPGGAKTNFIKRLVGKPGERLRLRHGDVFTRKLSDPGEEEIERKPPEKLLAMLQTVFDNRVIPRILEQGWPARWAGGSSWTTEDYVSFQTDGQAEGEAWFRYGHRVAPPRSEPENRLTDEPPPHLIADFCAYNTQGTNPGSVQLPRLHWVGDLAVMCILEVQSGTGEVLFELVEGGRNMQCRIDVATGKATLTIGGTDPEGREAQTTDGRPYRLGAQTDVRGPGKYEIIFSNCDDQLRLWLDGDVVLFGESDEATYYRPLQNSLPVHNSHGPSDLSPVGIGTNGAALRVSDLKICRDIYYIAVKHEGPEDNTPISDFESPPQFGDYLFNPKHWGVFRSMREAVFELEEDQFLMLGDNSAQSKDSRLWPGVGYEQRYRYDRLPHYVHRDLLIGKAVYIYWPHSWDEIRSLGIPLPFLPNFARMGFVR